MGILDEVRLEPIPSDLAPPEVPFEFESSAGEVQVPLSGAVAPFDVDSVAAEPTWELPALGILDEVRLEPIPSDLAPPEVPFEFESSPGLVQVPLSSAVAPFDADSELPALGILDQVRREQIVSDLAPLEAPFEFESSHEPVQDPPSSGHAVAAFQADSATLDSVADLNEEIPALGTIKPILPEPIPSDLAPTEVPLEFESSHGPVQFSLKSRGVADCAAEHGREIPALGRLEEVRLEPIPSDLAPTEVPLEFESSHGPVQFSLKSRGVADCAAEHGREIPALGRLEEVRLEPIPSDLAPTEVPLEFESSHGPVQLSLRSSRGAADSAAEPGREIPALGRLDEVRPEPIPSDLAPTEVPLEFESFHGPVQLSLSTHIGTAAVQGDRPTLLSSAPDAEPAAGIPTEGNGTNSFFRLHPKVEPGLATAIAEEGASRLAGIDPSPLSFGSAPMRIGSPAGANVTALGMATPGTTELIRLAGFGPLPPDPSPWLHGGVPTAGENEQGPESSFNPQRLRYPPANLAIAREGFEGPAGLMASRWSAARPGHPEALGQPEDEPQRSGPAPITPSPVGQRVPAGPEFAPREPQFCAATPGLAPVQLHSALLQDDPPTESFRWPPAPPALPAVVVARSFPIQFAGTAAASMMLSHPGSRSPVWVGPASPTFFPPMLPREPISSAWASASFQRGLCRNPIGTTEPVAAGSPPVSGPEGSRSGPMPLLQAPSRTDLFVLAKPLRISLARPATDTLSEPSRWRQAPPGLPSGFFAKAFTFQLAGAASAPMTLPPFRAMHPAALATQRPEPMLAPGRAPFREDLPQAPFHPAPPFVFAKPLRISPLRLQTAARVKQFRWLQLSPSPPVRAWVKSLRISATGLTTASIVPPVFSVIAQPARWAGPVYCALSCQQPIPAVVGFETPVPACAPRNPALPHASAYLEPCGKPAGRGTTPDPRKRSAKLRNPSGIRRNLCLPGEFHRPYWADASCIWTAPSPAAAHPSALGFRCEAIHPAEGRVQLPATPAQAGRLMRQGILGKITPAVHGSPRVGFRAFGMNDFQRFRAAGRIQIRQPELRTPAPNDLPVPAASLPWRGVGIVSGIRLRATPVPLRPPLRTPSLC